MLDSNALANALADYNSSIAVIGADPLLLWRRARVNRLLGQLEKAIEDLRLAIKQTELGVAAKFSSPTHPFYAACLQRALGTALWEQAQAVASHDVDAAHKLQTECLSAVTTAVAMVQATADVAPSLPDEFWVQYCDALNNRAWLAIAHEKNFELADGLINQIVSLVRADLWEHDVFLVGTRLRLAVEQLEKASETGGADSLGFAALVGADALRTQLFQALDEEDDYVSPATRRSMLDTINRLNDLWAKYTLATTTS